MSEQFVVKGLMLLKRNIQELMTVRHINQVQIGDACGHTKSWINKFIKEPSASMDIRDLDKLAACLGVDVFQLFQPGIGRISERRRSQDRRSGQERRIGPEGRHLAKLRTEVNRLPRGGSLGGVTTARLPTAVSAEARNIIERADRDLHALDTRGQAPAPRPAQPSRPKSDRGVRRSATKEGR